MINIRCLVMSMISSLITIPLCAATVSPSILPHPTTSQLSAANSTKEVHKININTATSKELKSISGITAYKARAIVKYRQQHGKFVSLDNLKMVTGFKRLSAEKLKIIQDQLTIN